MVYIFVKVEIHSQHKGTTWQNFDELWSNVLQFWVKAVRLIVSHPYNLVRTASDHV